MKVRESFESKMKAFIKHFTAGVTFKSFFCFISILFYFTTCKSQKKKGGRSLTSSTSCTYNTNVDDELMVPSWPALHGIKSI